jgi:hypothetical protein
VWANGNGCVGGCLALTALVLQAGQVIVESDVTFNNTVSWNTNGTDFDTEAIAAHELGHALGIHHTDVTTAPTPTMNASSFGPGGRTLAPDDIEALQCSQNRFPPRRVLRVGVPAVTALVLPDSTVSLTASILRGPGYTAPVSFALLTAPPGVTLTQLPDPAPGATATLTLTVPATVAFGEYPVTLLASGGGETDVDTVTLRVKRLLVSIGFGGITLVPGGPTQSIGITLLRAPGFVEPVSFSITGLVLEDTGVLLKASPFTTGNTGTLTGRAFLHAPAATYRPTLTATAASASDTERFEVTVVPLQ